jgi:hypothetical protein
MGKRPFGTLLALAWLSACGSSPKPQASAEPAASSSAAVDASADKHETEGQRRARLGLARREQCRALGSAIQDAQRQDIIINTNDTAGLQRLARELDRSSTAVEAVEIGDEGLARLRKEYVTNTREMSKQLGVMATVKSESARRAASNKFSACQDKVGGHIKRLDEYCNAPLK